MKLSSADIRAMGGRPDLEMPPGKQWRWNWRKAAENLPILAMLAFVVVAQCRS